jgi:hypothetical protein
MDLAGRKERASDPASRPGKIEFLHVTLWNPHLGLGRAPVDGTALQTAQKQELAFA